MDLVMVHIPKTAGSSIILTYKNEISTYWGHNTRSENFIKYPDFIKNEMGRKKLFQMISLQRRKKNTFSFAVIRNTWERVYSSYNYLTKGGLEPEDRVDYKKYIEPFIDFNHFVLNGLERAFYEQIHFRSQLFWIADENLNIRVDNIIDFEHVNCQMKQMMSKFHLPSRDLVVYNRYDATGYREIYSNDSIRKVAEIYSDEIDKFHFKYF